MLAKRLILWNQIGSIKEKNGCIVTASEFHLVFSSIFFLCTTFFHNCFYFNRGELKIKFINIGIERFYKINEVVPLSEMIKISSAGVRAPSISSSVQAINSNVDSEDNISTIGTTTIYNNEDLEVSEGKEEAQSVDKIDNKKKVGSDKSQSEIIDSKKVRSYECSVCLKSYTRSNGLEKHILSVHKSYFWRCLVCEMTFVSRDNAERHRKKKFNHTK